MYTIYIYIIYIRWLRIGGGIVYFPAFWLGRHLNPFLYLWNVHLREWLLPRGRNQFQYRSWKCQILIFPHSLIAITQILQDPPLTDVPVSECDPESTATKRACEKHTCGESSHKILELYPVSGGRGPRDCGSSARFSVMVRKSRRGTWALRCIWCCFVCLVLCLDV